MRPHTLVQQSQRRHVGAIPHVEEQRHVVDDHQVDMVLADPPARQTHPVRPTRTRLATPRTSKHQTLCPSSTTPCPHWPTTHLTSVQIPSADNPRFNIAHHLATISGDFFGSISSNSGSKSGYCSIHGTSQYRTPRPPRPKHPLNDIAQPHGHDWRHATQRNAMQVRGTHLIGDVLANFPLHGRLHLVLARHLLGRESGGATTAHGVRPIPPRKHQRSEHEERARSVAGPSTGGRGREPRPECASE
jgi:hypothetical protein